MRSLVHFFGLRRSGNHSIINHLLQNGCKTPVRNSFFFNDVYAPDVDPPYYPPPETFRVDSNSNSLLVVLSYEDLLLNKANTLPTIVNQDKILTNCIYRNCLVIRDPYNCFASRLQRLRNLEKDGVRLERL